jgi:hypothetical protein
MFIKLKLNKTRHLEFLTDSPDPLLRGDGSPFYAPNLRSDRGVFFQPETALCIHLTANR